MTTWSEDTHHSTASHFSPSKFGLTSSQDQSPAQSSDWLSPSKSSSQDVPLPSDDPLQRFQFGARNTNSFFNFGGAGSTETSPQKPLAKSCREENASRSSLADLPRKLFQLDLSPKNTELNPPLKRTSSDSSSEEQSSKKRKLSHDIDITIKDSIQENFYQRKTHIISTLETLIARNEKISLMDLLFALDPVFEKHYQQYVDAETQENKKASGGESESQIPGRCSQYHYPEKSAHTTGQILEFSKRNKTGGIFLYTGSPKRLAPFTLLIISELLPNFDHQAKPQLEAELEKMYQWLPQEMNDACKRKFIIEELNGLLTAAEYFRDSKRKLPFTLPGRTPADQIQHLIELISRLTIESDSMEIEQRFASPADSFFHSPANTHQPFKMPMPDLTKFTYST